MKKWSITATLNQSITSVPIIARCAQTAVAITAKEIAARSTSDMRFEKGRIDVKDPDGKIVYTIPEDGTGEACFCEKKKGRPKNAG